MKTKQLTLFALIASIMLILGYIFEALLPFGFLASYVTPSPVEGLLLFLIMVAGFRKTLITFISYVIILFALKGVSPLLLNEIALIISATITMSIFYLLYIKNKVSFIVSSIITILFTTIMMTLLNAYFITPTFVKQVWTTYKIAFPGQNFTTVLKYVSRPLPFGGGIVHGNIIKYTFCFALAAIANHTYKLKR